MDNLKCRACESPGLKRMLELGSMPSVNAFIEPSALDSEKKYPLTLSYCPSCLLVQLESIVPPEELFSNYLHLSSGSASNINHLKEFAEVLKTKLNVTSDTRILEIGSNDGTLLAYMKKYTLHVLGVDPARNLVELSNKQGVETLPIFFNQKTAEQISESKGKFDVIVALNVIPHTPNVVDLLRGVNHLLSNKGVLVMEGAYALETIFKGEFDTVYHEHVYCFSLHALISTFKQAGLSVFDVKKIPTQGGSLRIFAKKNDSNIISIYPSVEKILNEEKATGLTDRKFYDGLSVKAEKFKRDIRHHISAEKVNGKLIGLGAPARGMVILNYCGINDEDLEYIIDDTPLKIGKLAPGVHVPIRSWDALKSQEKRTFLLLSWNYKDHILSKLKQYAPGSRVIIPFPTLEVKQLD